MVAGGVAASALWGNRERAEPIVKRLPAAMRFAGPY